MIYSNPLGIFSEAQLAKFETGNLKSLKKEILLHFQLSDEATIERNGRLYDKNQILEIFDDLQENKDRHLKIFNNKPLLEFLENKGLSFFKDTKAKYAVQHDIVYRDQIDTHIANQLNIITADLVNNVSSTSAETLQLILEYTGDMNSSIQDKAYNKAYIEMKAHVDSLSIEYPTPFLSDGALTVDSDLNDLINPSFYNCFKYLPGAFQDIGFNYAVWCHNDIVNKAFRREPNYTLFAKGDLKIIAKAMDIGSEITKSEAFRQNTQEVKNYLRGGRGFTSRTESKQTSRRPNTSQRKQARPQRTHYETDTTNSSWTALKTILIVLLLSFKVLFLISKCNRNNSSYRANTYKQYTERQNYGTYAKPNTAREKRMEKKRIRKAKEAIHAQYAGDDKLLWSPRLLRSEEVNNVIELDYEVDIFPSNYYDFHTLIPTDIRRKYMGKKKDFVVKFTSKDFPDRSQSHRFRTEVRSFINRSIIVLDAKKSDRSDKFALTIKRILKKKKLKGSITKYTTAPHGEISKVLFEIRDDLEMEPQIEEEDNVPPSFAEAKFDKWNDFSISNVADQNYKNIILNNFNKIAYKVLKQGNYYAIQTMATYIPNPISTKDFHVNHIREIKANVTLNYVSNEDEMATLTLYGENLYIRYFVSNDTKRIVGMNMVVAQDGFDGGIEVIEVFFE